MHGQAHHLSGQLLGDRGAVGAAEVGVGRLFVERHRVVHGGGEAGVMQAGLEGVAILDPEGVLGEDAGAVVLEPGRGRKGSRKDAKAQRGSWSSCCSWRLGVFARVSSSSTSKSW